MSNLGHWHYVALAYGAAAIVVLGLIVAVIRDHRAQKSALDRLEARGVRRRPRGSPDGVSAPAVARS